MARTFKNFEAFQQSSPEGMRVSKIDFADFKGKAVADRRLFDTNINARLCVEQKIIAGKNREQTNRALALGKNF